MEPSNLSCMYDVVLWIDLVELWPPLIVFLLSLFRNAIFSIRIWLFHRCLHFGAFILSPFLSCALCFPVGFVPFTLVFWFLVRFPLLPITLLCCCCILLLLLWLLFWYVQQVLRLIHCYTISKHQQQAHMVGSVFIQCTCD